MAKVSVRRGYWILSWQQNGKTRRQSLGRVGILVEKDARAIERAKTLELTKGFRLLNINRAPAPTFGQFAAQYLQWHAGEFPDSHYRVAQIVEQHLVPRFEFKPLDMLSIGDGEQFKTERRFQAKAATVIKELRVWQALMNRAVALKVIAQNPLAAVKAPRNLDSKPHRFYEADELLALYAACRVKVNNGEGPQPDPMRAFVWKLYANTGMRRMEGLHLLRKWVGSDGLKIVSTGEERTKSGEWREIPLTDGAREALETLPRSGPYVLPRMHPASLSRSAIKDAQRAGLDGSLHTLRHTYISHLVRAGVPLRTMQLYAGHAHITTTEGYAYLSPGQAPDQVLKLAL